MPTDAELLQRYARDRDEAAFAELVRRHLGLVYAAAHRRTGGRAQVAEEVAQKVFCDLARKSAALCRHPALPGWLYRSTRYAAIDALRAECRREKLAQEFGNMSDSSAAADGVDWERLRPVLDAAMDALPDRDREVMLLRYFHGLSYVEVGARLQLNENAARMRADRALTKLRAQLERRGVTSTTAALALVMANPALASAPAGLAAGVTTAAVAVAPAGAIGTAASLFLMSKLTVPILSAAVAAGLTALVWTSAVPTVGAGELAALRAENVRLKSATAAGAPAASLVSVADEFAVQARAIADAVDRRLAERGAAGTAAQRPSGEPAPVDPGRHRNRGQATAHDAYMSFAWAADAGEISEMAKLLTFEDRDRPKALAVLASMPEEIRTQYPTPEELYAFFFAADALVAPPPGPDVIAGSQAFELSPGRMVLRRPGAPARKYDHQYQLTPTGWKYVIPDVGVENAPNVLNNETLRKLGQPAVPGHP